MGRTVELYQDKKKRLTTHLPIKFMGNSWY